MAAAYEYAPFGEPLRAGTFDATVADQPFRFSTKFTDLETGLVDYGRRLCSPDLGRDPIEEKGGLRLYAFVTNNPVNKWDVRGMTIEWIFDGTSVEMAAVTVTESRWTPPAVNIDAVTISTEFRYVDGDGCFVYASAVTQRPRRRRFGQTPKFDG